MTWGGPALAITALGALLVWLFPIGVARALIKAARLALGLSERNARVDGFNIAYLEGGYGRPLVLLHGMGADKDNFLLIARQLKRRFRLVIPDLPGFGDSDKPADQTYTIAEQVERLHEFVRALGITRFHLGGNSMGGFIAAAYAARYPEDLESLWLLAPAGVRSAEPSELLKTIANGGDAQILARTSTELREAVSFVFHRKVHIPHFLARYQVDVSRKNYDLHSAIIPQLVQGAWLEELLEDRIEVPTLILWGDCDRAVHVSGAEILSRLLPNSKVAILKDVGHIPMLEAPNKSVAAFLSFEAERQAAITAA